MDESLFKQKTPRNPAPNPYELIEPEIVHLRKGYSIRHGPKRKRHPLWLLVLTFCTLAWLYLMDPVLHAWYKGEAVKTYLYLHNFGSAQQVDALVASRILSPEEVHVLDGRRGSFQDYYPSPQQANDTAQTIMDYMAEVRALHAGRYQSLDPVGRMRYLLFIRTGLVLPTSWDFLDPSVND